MHCWHGVYLMSAADCQFLKDFEVAFPCCLWLSQIFSITVGNAKVGFTWSGLTVWYRCPQIHRPIPVAGAAANKVRPDLLLPYPNQGQYTLIGHNMNQADHLQILLFEIDHIHRFVVYMANIHKYSQQDNSHHQSSDPLKVCFKFISRSKKVKSRSEKIKSWP